MLIRLSALLCGPMVWGLAAVFAFAEEKPAAAPDFKQQVLPILEAKCIRCHGGQRRGGQLDMRSLDAMLKGGVSGPAIKKGNAQKSLLIELIHFNEMPPKKEMPRVTKEELELLRKWIDAMPQGADSAPGGQSVGAPPRSTLLGREFRVSPSPVILSITPAVRTIASKRDVNVDTNEVFALADASGYGWGDRALQGGDLC